MAALLLGVLWVLWVSLRSDGVPAARWRQGTPVHVDRPSPAFTRPLLSERGSLSLRRYEGHVVVVNFWASWCTACRSEASQLESVWRAFRGRGVRFVGVDYQDDRGAAIDFARSLGMSYPSVLDTDGRVGGDFGIFGLPTTYIIGPDTRIRYVVNGGIRATSFRVALESVAGTAGSEAAGS
jgi:cytochrome c biogenesis protein CcmG/thiol:disulfide interchange protein DsbE